MKKIILSLLTFCMLSASAQNEIVVGDMNDSGDLTIGDVTALTNAILHPENARTISTKCDPNVSDPAAIAGQWRTIGGTALSLTTEGDAAYSADAMVKSFEYYPYRGDIVLLNEGGYAVKCLHVARLSNDYLVLSNADGSCTAYYPRDLFANGFVISATSISLKTGETQQLCIIATPEGSISPIFEWTSSNTAVATVDQNGLVTAVKGGTATITATAQDGSSVSVECSVDVVQLVESITLSSETLRLDVDESAKLTATVLPEDAIDRTYTWSSSNEDIAEVTRNGVVYANGYGTCTITVTANDGSGVKAECVVTVEEPKPEVKDDNGIITSPAEGEEFVFNRTGGSVLYLKGFSTSEAVQRGTSKFVFCDDGTVYWNHPLSDALESQMKELTDTWVKGKLEGETITFEPGQPISVSARPPYPTYNLYMCDFNESESNPDAVPVKNEPIVLKFSRGGKVLELQNSSKKHLLGVFFSTTGYSASSHWDYETSYTRDTTDEHDPAVTLPAGVSTTNYISNGYDATIVYDPEIETSYPIGDVSFASQLGFDGEDAYLSNFSFYGIDHWLKGKRQADGSIVFPKEQYILTTNDHYDLYVYALPHGSNNADDACDLVLTYDAATKDYVSGQDLFISYEKISDKLESIERIENFKLIFSNDAADAPIFKASKDCR